jgi:cytochrome c oxidase subunit 3
MSDAALREPFSDLGRQRESALLGIWLFLATEVLFFGGLFAGYTIYRILLNPGFLAGAAETDLRFGGPNTAILILSSFTMATGVRAARFGLLRMARIAFAVTAILGTGFLVVKGFEYSSDVAKHFIPTPGFPIAIEGAEIFCAFYWVMTMIHAVHLTVGIGLVLRLLAAGWRNPAWLRQSPAIAVTGIYWSYVDIVWLFLFPLLYLAARA